MPLARAEARKALELVPSEPKAHAVLGAIAASHDYDWKEADEQFRLARASESLPPAVHDMYADCLIWCRWDDSKKRSEQQAKAIAQDPLNMYWHAHQGFTLLCAEMYERAIGRSTEGAGVR